MVIQDESEAPTEVSVMKTPHLEAKKYIIVKNHVRELPITDRASSGHSSAQDDSSESETSAKKTKKSTKKENKVINKEIHRSASKNVCNASNVLLDIRRDLQELKKELQECFSRLGAKVDHIAQSIESGTSTQSHNLTDSIIEEDCHCTVNKKIIFDEDGQQRSVSEAAPDNHVCLKKLKRKYSDVARNIDIHTLAMAQKSNDTQNLSVEYEEENIALPEDLVSLTNILQDSDIAISYRNKVIDKVKLLKQEHSNEIRFNRPSMIEKLKSSSESNEVFEFKGANLFSLPGYPDWK